MHLPKWVVSAPFPCPAKLSILIGSSGVDILKELSALQRILTSKLSVDSQHTKLLDHHTSTFPMKVTNTCIRTKMQFDMHSFIHYKDSCNTTLRLLLRIVPDPSVAEKNSLKGRTE